MRRGLLSWDEAEVPAAVLDARVARCRDAMTADGLDALLLYNNFPRPAAVSWLTHFVPYWSQGVLVLPPDGPPEYFVSLSKRVAGWIAETSHMGEIVSTPRLGADLAKRLDDTKRVGIVELGRLPGGVGRPLSEALTKTEMVDATALFRSVRHPADDAEIAITRSAAALASECLDKALGEGPWRRSGALTAAIEGPARLAGAEEVIVELAPDLAHDTALRRIDGDVELRARYAVRVSLARKGHWVRIGRTPGDGDEKVAAWLASNPTPSVGAADGGITVDSVVLEACIGTAPLSPVVGLPAGAPGVVGAVLSVDGAPHLASLPVLSGDGGVVPL
jgi:hypothetical protein